MRCPDSPLYMIIFYIIMWWNRKCMVSTFVWRLHSPFKRFPYIIWEITCFGHISPRRILNPRACMLGTARAVYSNNNYYYYNHYYLDVIFGFGVNPNFILMHSSTFADRLECSAAINYNNNYYYYNYYWDAILGLECTQIYFNAYYELCWQTGVLCSSI